MASIKTLAFKVVFLVAMLVIFAGASQVHKKKSQQMKERLKVDELEENKVELKEAARNVFPALVLTGILSGVLLLIFLLRLYIRWGPGECPSKNRLEGKTVIITGANTGLGKATAMELAKRGARVIMGCRDKIKADAVARLIRKKTGNQNVLASQLDLASLRSIQDFAKEVNDNEPTVHILINNAAYLGPKAATDDGYERSLGVNYLGHFYLTLLLHEKMRKCAPSRIINVASDAYLGAKLDLDDLALLKGYDAYGAYGRSKLAQLIFNMECHRHFFSACVWSFAVHPGACCTDLMRNFQGMYGNILRGAARVLFKSPEEGCQSIVYCAVADGLRDFSGKLFNNCKCVKMNDVARDRLLGRRLWNISLHLTKLEDEFVPYAEEETTSATAENGSNVIETSQEIPAAKTEPAPGTTGPEKRPATSPKPASTPAANPTASKPATNPTAES